MAIKGKQPDIKRCPFCAEEIRLEAIKCRYCGSMLGPRPSSGEWYREPDGKILTGVCSGLAGQFAVSVTALRVAFIIGTFIGGWGLLIYLALWIIMPVRTLPASDLSPREANPPEGER